MKKQMVWMDSFGRTTQRQYDKGGNSWKTGSNCMWNTWICQGSEETTSIYLRCTDVKNFFIAGEITKWSRRKVACAQLYIKCPLWRCPFWTEPWPINKEPKLENTVWSPNKFSSMFSHHILLHATVSKVQERHEVGHYGWTRDVGRGRLEPSGLKNRGDHC